MKSLIMTLLISLSMIIVACSSEKKDSSAESTATNIYNIELDGDQKWKVDKVMLQHIRNIEEEINEFSEVGDQSYNNLAVSLDEHIQLLTSNCTMSGQAHDELHKWLLPFIDLVDELSKAGSTNEKADVYSRMTVSMVQFNIYFN